MGGRQLILNGDIMKVKAFTHDSGFNSIQGKYSIGYNTRGLLMASEDYCESKMVYNTTDSPDIRMRVNEYGQIVYPPEKPEKPDTSNWKRITPKRQGILAQYRVDKAQYEKDMEEWLDLPFADEGRTRDEFIHDLVHALRTKPRFVNMTITRWSYHEYLNGTFEYKVPVFQYGKYKVFKDKKMVEKYTRSELPEWAVARHEMEIVTPVEGESWIKQVIIDLAYRKAMIQQRLKEKRQSPSKFKKSQEDKTVQYTLTGNVWNTREVDKDFLHTFTGDAELVWKFYKASFKVKGCIHGSVDINNALFELTKEELDEVYRMRGGK